MEIGGRLNKTKKSTQGEQSFWRNFFLRGCGYGKKMKRRNGVREFFQNVIGQNAGDGWWPPRVLFQPICTG